ncbi:LEM domain-containing protein 1 isoform X2 [Gasterosteus aculeatus]|uniref:LEM domain-containing protein 1 isoform X2 n=1 Tax=Gasterosteus aculeatus aculeatus TaxID=481459 RepID=UPI001A9A2913|nr:LEM domain-containing protein 1 isoform X2 [Gasterosteus aculeatus aculeatus]
MSLFSENPAHFSKSRLKSDLVAHNVALPPAKSRKHVYVELHLKHIQRKNAAEFSSDEEDQVQNAEVSAVESERMPDLSGLTDDDLKAALLRHGVEAGPIVASTRGVYENKLRKLLQSDGQGVVNGAEQGVLYSDSEDEAETLEQDVEESGSKKEDRAQQGSSETGDFVYPQCFLPQSRLYTCASRNGEISPKWNSGNAIKSLERSRPSSQISEGISRAPSVDRRSGLGSGFASGSVMLIGDSTISSQAFSITQMVEEMESSRSHSADLHTERDVNGCNVQQHWSRINGLDVETPKVGNMKNQPLFYTPKESTYESDIEVPVKDTFSLSNTTATPTGIYATRRRPIKGAAGRPVQNAYPDTPASPTTKERREVERRLVPIQIQILVFLLVVCLLYLIYVCVEDDSFSTFATLLDSLDQGADGHEGLALQAEDRDTPALSVRE